MIDENPTARSALFCVHMKPCTTPGDARYGLTATKRTFKFAVQRNRAKRLLRDWVRFNEKHLRPDMDYIFIARRPILGATREEGRDAMAHALAYLKKNPKSDAK